MSNYTSKQLRMAVVKYTTKSTANALTVFIVDMLLYLAAITGAIMLENALAKIACAVLAGFKIASIFVIAHDAAHDSLTGNRKLNRIIGRITFLPALHNFSLWIIAHNRLHHQLANLKGANSWSPFSKDDYDALPLWRKGLERLYRSPLGLGVYYLVERWWKDKFFPYKRLTGEYKPVYWLDFALVAGYLTGFISILLIAGATVEHTTAMESVLVGFVIPYVVFNYMMGFTIYQHHTHETIPWFDSNDERQVKGASDEVTMHVKYPVWYNLISHNIMEHTAHHIDPRIPLYNLAEAQADLANMLGDDMHCMSFSFRKFLHTLSVCKLYDYENHCWLDFEGRVTTGIILNRNEVTYAEAA